MTLFTRDLVQTKELSDRATALVAWAVCRDSRNTNDPLGALDARGWARFHTHTKAAVAAMTTADEGVALLPLTTAFLGQVDAASFLGRLLDGGAVQIPLASVARLQLGSVTATPVGETESKPVGRIDFSLTGPPQKVVAEIIASSELLRAVDADTQRGLARALVSATATAQDVRLVGVLTAGTPAASSDPATLFAQVSGGQPAAPFLLGGYDTLLPLVARLADLKALGIGIIATPAAAGMLIAVDAAGLCFSDGGAVVTTARHATVTLDDGAGSPAATTLTSLWQSNLQAIRAERAFMLAVRAGAVAFASTGSPA